MTSEEKELLLKLIESRKAVYVQRPMKECRKKGICVYGPECSLFPLFSRYPRIRGLCRSKPKNWEARWRRIIERHSKEAVK